MAIIANRAASAQRALHLILIAHTLIHEMPPPVDVDDLIIDGCDRHTSYASGAISCSAIDYPVACHIAAKASTRRDYVYAMALYQLSQDLHCNADIDLDPRYYPLQQRSSYPLDHARLAYAIVTAYAVIEQLQLTPVPQSFEKRQWIPAKRHHLERRLAAAGVDLSERMPWQIRGGRSSLEIRSRRTNVRRTRLAYGRVRDAEIEVVDAIDDVRSIRSGIAAHRMDKLARAISIHDVSNAQALARRLLLDSLGITAEWTTQLRASCR